MPLFDFTCESCGHKFDKLVRTVSDGEPKAQCPKCGSAKTKRALSLVSVGAGNTGGGEAEMPMCGRCGGPGPCAMGN